LANSSSSVGGVSVLEHAIAASTLASSSMPSTKNACLRIGVRPRFASPNPAASERNDCADFEDAACATAPPAPCGDAEHPMSGFPPPLTPPRKGEGDPVGASGEERQKSTADCLLPTAVGSAPAFAGA
jgi:hypothetical protein